MQTRWRAAEMWLTVMQSWIGLRFWPAFALRHFLDAPEYNGRVADRGIVDDFKRLTHGIANGRCLLLAVALTRFLRRRDVAAYVRIGFDRSQRKLAGHAWVVCGDEIVSDAATIDRHFRDFNVTASGLSALLTGRGREARGEGVA